jgi:hypothetical protein
MNHSPHRAALTRASSAAAMVMSLLVICALAALGSDYDLAWHTVDGGGGSSGGGGYELAGTIGQPDAGALMSGGEYTLAGGFWVASAPASEPPCPLPGDINCDGVVDDFDLLLLMEAWGPCPDCADCPGDLNGDCVVDVHDLLLLLASWG